MLIKCKRRRSIKIDDYQYISHSEVPCGHPVKLKHVVREREIAALLLVTFSDRVVCWPDCIHAVLVLVMQHQYRQRLVLLMSVSVLAGLAPTAATISTLSD